MWAIDGEDTRLLGSRLSVSRIAFIYAEDLWVANRDGSYPAELLRAKDQNQTRCSPLMET